MWPRCLSLAGRRALHPVGSRSFLHGGVRPLPAAAGVPQTRTRQDPRVNGPPGARWSTTARPVAATGTSSAASSPRASASSSSVPPAGGWFGRLEDQSVISITSNSPTASAGELLKYVHNLTTQDMYAASSSEHHGCGYTMFLNSKGRVLFDALFAPMNEDSVTWLQQAITYTVDTTKGPAGVARSGTFPSPLAKPPPAPPGQAPRGLYLTVPTAVLPVALAHLQQFNIRRKVVITDVSSSVEVWQAIPFVVLDDMKHGRLASQSNGSREEAQRFLGMTESTELSVTVDPRTPAMGLRILTPSGVVPSLPSSFRHITDSSFFHTYRLLMGISSSPHEILPEKSLPLEHSLSSLHGVSFFKGCYLGQELTARTFHQGVVRKKVWPVYVEREDQRNGDGAKPGPAPKLHELMQRSPSSSSTAGDHWKQLQSFFPFFRYSPTPVLPVDAPITREPVSSPSGPSPSPPASPPSKEVSRVLSSRSNLALAMLRSEHVEDATMQLRAQGEDGRSQRIVPYEPSWWTAGTTQPEAKVAKPEA
jgi:folate-binding protein YgfZ